MAEPALPVPAVTCREHGQVRSREWLAWFPASSETATPPASAPEYLLQAGGISGSRHRAQGLGVQREESPQSRLPDPGTSTQTGAGWAARPWGQISKGQLALRRSTGRPAVPEPGSLPLPPKHQPPNSLTPLASRPTPLETCPREIKSVLAMGEAAAASRLRAFLPVPSAPWPTRRFFAGSTPSRTPAAPLGAQTGLEAAAPQEALCRMHTSTAPSHE